MKKTVIRIVALVALLFCVQPDTHAQQKPLEKVRLTVPAKALTFVPYYFGKAQEFLPKKASISRSSSCGRLWASRRSWREISTIPRQAVCLSRGDERRADSTLSRSFRPV